MAVDEKLDVVTLDHVMPDDHGNDVPGPPKSQKAARPATAPPRLSGPTA